LTVKAKYEDSVRLDRMPELAKEEPEMFAYLMKAYETQWTIVEEVLSQGISEGIYKDFNVTLIRMLLQNGMQMLYTNQFLIKSQMRYETALKEVVEIVLDGIRKK
jgi:antitoxin component YwqK of YwqJK toxin-antitoxin module